MEELHPCSSFFFFPGPARTGQKQHRVQIKPPPALNFLKSFDKLRLMKIRILLVFFFPLLSFAQTENSLFTVDTIPVGEASRFYGKYKSFCDTIAAVREMQAGQGGLTMITLGKGPEALQIVIWDDDAKKFPKAIPALYHPGDRICAIGQISRFGNRPRLEVGTPRQIHKVP